jgi:hypothetical protein
MWLNHETVDYPLFSFGGAYADNEPLAECVSVAELDDEAGSKLVQALQGSPTDVRPRVEKLGDAFSTHASLL